MKPDNAPTKIVNEQVNVIDKITVPVKAIAAFAEKSAYIRNFLRQQPGFIKDQAFQQKDENGTLIVITIATWASQQHLEQVKTAMQTELKNKGINMPEFLKQQGIGMDRGVYAFAAE